MGRYFLILIAAYIVPALFTSMSAKSVCNIALPVTGEEVVLKEVTAKPCSKTLSKEKTEKRTTGFLPTTFSCISDSPLIT